MENTILERKEAKLANGWSLSFEQEYLWLQEQLYAGNKSLSYFCMLKLTGNLHMQLLEESINEILKRHEALRTYFPIENGLPVQRIHSFQKIKLPLIDLSHLDEDERTQKIGDFVRAEKTNSFNTSTDFLFRIHLIRSFNEEHFLTIHTSRLLFDEWSLKNFTNELSHLYRKIIKEQCSFLSELPFQYKNYAEVQRSNLSGETIKRDLTYWKKKLETDVPELNLPFDFPQPTTLKFSGKTYRFTLPRHIHEKVKVLAENEMVSPFVIVLSVLKVLLYRYSSELDISVGTFVSGRNHSDTKKLIGQFTNLLIMRTQLPDDISFREALQEVNKVCLEAYKHQNVPISKLIAEYSPDHKRNRNPFFQVMVDMPELKKEKIQSTELQIEEVSFEYDTTLFDFTLRVVEGNQGEWQCSFIYNPEIFLDETVIRMAGHFEKLLQEIINDPDISISRAPLLTTQERHLIVDEWNSSEASYPRNASINQLFEEQVELNADGIALIFGHTTITYQELNKRANQIANYLRKLNIKNEQLVAICLDRPPDMIASFLGVLKAGGAYVPFDLSYPKERIAYVLEDSGASFVITTEQISKDLPHTDARIVLLDKEASEITNLSERSIDYSSPDNLAYVIYTSGSTGKPKGVEIVHRGVVRLIKDIDYAHLTQEEVLLNLTPVAFDASVFDIYGALLNGCKLVMMNSNKPTFKEIGATIKQHSITVLGINPSKLNLLLEDYIDDLSSLRQVLSVGEALPVWLAHKFLSRLKGCQLINAYGPTENSVYTTSYHVKEIPPNASSVPIGRPIPDDKVYILDKYLNPVPIGITGELYLTGVGIARGYHNKVDLTREKFPDNPFGNNQGQKLYKTGDLARYRSDGIIEFLGRNDDQVKIRGTRIELGEIESIVGLLPGVRQAVAGTVEGKEGNKDLVAYLVMNQGVSLNQQLIRAYAREKMPEHMIPTFFMELEEIPVTPVGKVDRRRLPAPTITVSKQETTLPRNQTEQQLVKLWESLIDFRPIGIKDGFFDLGGNSLLAMRMFSEIEKAFRKKLSVSSIFQEDTIEKIAKLILSDDHNKGMSSPLVPIQSLGTHPPLYCIHGGGGEVLIYSDLARKLGENQPVYGLKFPNMENQRQVSVESLAEQYIDEIRQVQPNGPYYLLGFCFGGAIAYEMAQKLHQKGEKIALLSILNFANPKYEPVKLQKEVTYRNVIIDNLKLLYKKPLPQKFSFFLEKTQNAVKLFKNTSISDNFSEEVTATKPMLTKAISVYAPKPFPDRLLLILASEDYDRKDSLGWQVTEGGSIIIQSVPAKHETLLKEPYVGQVAEHLKDYLEMVKS